MEGAATTADDKTGVFRDVESIWTRIEASGGVGTPYQSIAWLEQWLRHCGADIEPWLRVLSHGHTIAPLGQTRIAGLRVLKLLGTGESDYLGLVSLCPARDAWDALGAELARARGFDLLHLNSVLEPREVVAGLSNYLPGPLCRPYETCPRIRVDGSWNDLLASRGRDFRKNVRRWSRRVEELGSSSIEVLRPPVDSAILRELEDVERSSWKWDSGEASFRSRRQRAFLSGLLLDPRMDLRLWLLRIDRRLAAFAIVLVGRNAWYYYLSSFRQDEAHTGAHLLARIVERACETPECQFVDLLRGSFGYKKFWTDESRTVYEIVCPRSLSGRVLSLAYALRWRAAQNERLRRIRSGLLGVGDRRRP